MAERRLENNPAGNLRVSPNERQSQSFPQQFPSPWIRSLKTSRLNFSRSLTRSRRRKVLSVNQRRAQLEHHSDHENRWFFQHQPQWIFWTNSQVFGHFPVRIQAQRNSWIKKTDSHWRKDHQRQFFWFNKRIHETPSFSESPLHHFKNTLNLTCFNCRQHEPRNSHPSPSYAQK